VNLKENGTVVIDSDFVKAETKRPDITVKVVDATKRASELGKIVLANMIMLGALVNIIHLVPENAIINALKETVSDRNLSENLMAVDAGLKLGAGEVG